MCENCGCNSNQECSCGCGCECHGQNNHFERHYQTKSEQIVELETYLNELKKEVQAVEEHLADLRK